MTVRERCLSLLGAVLLAGTLACPERPGQPRTGEVGRQGSTAAKAEERPDDPGRASRDGPSTPGGTGSASPSGPPSSVGTTGDSRSVGTTGDTGAPGGTDTAPEKSGTSR